MLVFKPLTQNDFLLLATWFKQPHIAQWWESEDEHMLLKKLDSTWLNAFIVYLDNGPIGYMQCYDVCNVGNGWWLDQPEGTWGIDQFIGEPDCIGKGYGTQMIQEFVAILFKDQKITRVIADPKPHNTRAIRVYERVGFKNIGLRQTPDGIVTLMEITKPL